TRGGGGACCRPPSCVPPREAPAVLPQGKCGAIGLRFSARHPPIPRGPWSSENHCHARESGHPVTTILRDCAPQGLLVCRVKPGDDKLVVGSYTEPSILAEEPPCS